MHVFRTMGCISAIVTAALSFGCGGSSTPEPQTASEPADESAFAEEPDPDMDEASADETDGEQAAASGEDEAAEAETAEPSFPENASVDDAIKAVPPGAERLNLDQERLASPLQDPKVYEPCNPGTQHFKLKIAVWNGRAVGIDVDTKNAKLADCLRSQIQELEWPDKVKSLNTIEYGM